MEPIQIPPVDLKLLAPLLIVVGWATALLLIDTFLIPAGQKKITGYLALAGMLVAALAGIPLWNVGGSTFSGMIVLDPFSLTMTWIFLLTGALSVAMAL
ncbi:MAG: NADH-quinone oxidoreductase subunit N, partial [Chloroflexales bacterium]